MLHLNRHFLPVFDGLNQATAYPSTYDLRLVTISVAIAILAAFVALSISGRIVAATTQWARSAWASAGAISMGGGIWSMHFVGMLAFSLPCGITYEPVGTVSSLIPGMAASGIALDAISKPDEPGLGRRFVSAVLMGGGIAAMHYSGMAAMRPQAMLRYDPGLVGVSVVVAVVLAFISLSIRFHRPRSSGLAATISAATVMGCAVAGMHYTAMQAAIFYPLPDAPAYSMALSPTLLALLITFFAVLLAVSTLVAAFAGRQNELALSLTEEIARRRRIEADLRRSEAYLAEAQRLSHTGSWGFDVASRHFTHSSDEHHRLFGFNSGAAMPVWEDWARRLHPEDRDSTLRRVRQSIRERSDFELDYRIVHPDGTIRHIHEAGHPFLSPSGTLVEFVGSSIDRTELRRAEEARLDAQTKLSHANRVTTMGQLAASIAHEVNQPIAATLTNARAGLRWLDRRPPDVEEVRQALGRIVRDGNRAAEVIDEIRALVKKAPPRKDQLEINGAVREVIGLTRGEAVKQDVSVRTELAVGLPLVEGDRVQLQQVILNLIINAFEAMSVSNDGARDLLISTGKAEADGVFVAVRDTGPGLAPATVEHLFESFYTTKPGGLGLGLSICRSIIEGHGGRLWACANEPRGAVFQFTVPAIQVLKYQIAQ
ncbi:MAG TPA: MHYT domain-containing protein [Acetobacteraceae bacterium]|nr:MHYT domain-containing protein [Acetobacteraceae bacterium]